MDNAISLELDSDLTVDLWNKEISDKDDILTLISQISNLNEEQEQKLNDISSHLDSSIKELSERIDNLSIDSLDELIQNIEDNEEVIVNYLAIIDNSVNEQKELIENNSNTIDDVSTRLNGLSQVVDNLVDDPGYDDSTIKNRVTDVSQYSIDVSSKLNILTLDFEYERQARKEDDETMEDWIQDISSYSINVSSRLNDLSTFAHNITPGTTPYDDTNIKSRIADVSQYAIDLSTKIDEVSTRLSQSGGGSGDSISESERYARQNYTSAWHINHDLFDTSYLEFKDFVVYAPLISNKTWPYSESDLNDSSIILRTVATGSLETDRLYLIGHTPDYKVSMIVGGRETYLS